MDVALRTVIAQQVSILRVYRRGIVHTGIQRPAGILMARAKRNMYVRLFIKNRLLRQRARRQLKDSLPEVW